MLSGLPQNVDLYRLAVARETFEGRIEQSLFRRLASVAHETERWVDVTLRFGAEEGIHYLRGGLKSKFTVVCQRCLEPMEVVVDAPLQFGFVRNQEEEARLPEPFEPLWVDREEMNLFSIIEDELLLALPLVAMHPPAQCPAWVEPEQASHQVEGDRANPFAVLAALTRDKH